MAKRKKLVDSKAAMVEQLGGISAVGRLIRRSPSQVFYWLHDGKPWPPRFYFTMRDELRARGFDAPRYLWDFEPKQNSAAA